jgi:RHS repeat-associated protein
MRRSFPRKGSTRAALLALVGVSFLAAPAAAQVVEYYHLDAVGNVRAVTDGSGVVVERHDYLPFGEECMSPVCAGNPQLGAGTPRKFTGKERDTETGLDYFGARYYGSKIARFTTTDPAYTIAENVVEPQRWNRYAYGLNNPLKFVDPDGREVHYASDSLRTFFGTLASRSAKVQGTLDQYTGPGKPDLWIKQGDPGSEEEGQRNGSFTTQYNSTYPDTEEVKAAMAEAAKRNDAEAIKDLGTSTPVGATITIATTVPLSLLKSTLRTALHELGHADQAVRRPREAEREAPVKTTAKGEKIPWKDRPYEQSAERYREAAEREAKP